MHHTALFSQSTVKASTGLKIVAAVWLLAAVGGGWRLTKYSATPGAAAQAVSAWPATDRVHFSTDAMTLVMTLHADCPCSRASVNELEVLMTRCCGKLKATVLFAEPTGIDSVNSELWKSAARIGNVTCVRDSNGDLSARFNAKTSGQVFLYDTAGTLRFSGGITNSRGHAGDSDGLNAITAIVNGDLPTTRQTPVFGCSLR